jgi:2-polyprenyl-6-methoxyphenol hydroxylase-like FAD-dependent oxidoreductase
MGLLPAIRLASVNELGFAFVDRNGKHVAEMPVAAFDGEGIVAELEVLRGDLSRILYEATSDRVEYIFDDSIDDLVEDHNGVLVTFERAAARRFDMVIGADGVHSRVRHSPSAMSLHSSIRSGHTAPTSPAPRRLQPTAGS